MDGCAGLGYKSERAAHEVTIPSPFAVNTHELTVDEFRYFVDDTG